MGNALLIGRIALRARRVVGVQSVSFTTSGIANASPNLQAFLGNVFPYGEIVPAIPVVAMVPHAIILTNGTVSVSPLPPRTTVVGNVWLSGAIVQRIPRAAAAVSASTKISGTVSAEIKKSIILIDVRRATLLERNNKKFRMKYSQSFNRKCKP